MYLEGDVEYRPSNAEVPIHFQTPRFVSFRHAVGLYSFHPFIGVHKILRWPMPLCWVLLKDCLQATTQMWSNNMTRSIVILGLGLSSCTEYEYTSKTQKDVFQQSRRNTVDILLVVDDSCSMAEDQAKLANNFESFMAAFQGIDVDWQIGVTYRYLSNRPSGPFTWWRRRSHSRRSKWR